jgi:FAD/FMN-containing dehydrogenase
VHRSQFAVLAMETSWEPSDPSSTVDANLEWLDDLGASMRPFVGGSAYQNFIDRTQPNWQEAYYGANFDRLVRVKRKWDPDEVFRFQQSIPSR